MIQIALIASVSQSCHQVHDYFQRRTCAPVVSGGCFHSRANGTKELNQLFLFLIASCSVFGKVYRFSSGTVLLWVGETKAKAKTHV